MSFFVLLYLHAVSFEFSPNLFIPSLVNTCNPFIVSARKMATSSFLNFSVTGLKGDRTGHRRGHRYPGTKVINYNYRQRLLDQSEPLVINNNTNNVIVNLFGNPPSEGGSKTYFRVRNPKKSQKNPHEILTALKASSSWTPCVRSKNPWL